jgi:LCP family protein required for cell wall assembly
VSGAIVVRKDDRAPLAALLSFFIPGLGQAYNRDFRLAALMALPPIAFVLLLMAATGKGSGLLSDLLDVRILVAIILIDLALLGWRLVAIIQAHVAREPAISNRWTTWVTALLVLLTVGMHLLPAWYATATINTLNAVSVGGRDPNRIFVPPPSTPDPNRVVGPVHTPEPTPVPPITGRVAVLLVGLDSLPQRSTMNTDTMMVAILDPKSGPALISIPRDTFGTPMGDGRVYNSKLNSLLSAGTHDPSTYPLGGPGSLKAAVGALLGIQIDYMVAIDLLGFLGLVDTLGGVDITVTRGVYDSFYFNEYEQQTGFYLEPGEYHFDGHTALAYARTRFGIGDNDFTRAARQQELLEALVRQVTGADLLLNYPTLLALAGDSVASDIPVEHMQYLARLLEKADMSSVERLVIQYPLAYADNLTDGTYILVPDIEAIQAAVESMLSTDSGPAPPPD